MIAEAINNAGETYYEEKAKAWTSADRRLSRIYFGRDFVTIENGEIHNRRSGKSAAKTAGESAVELVEKYSV